jgi:hypothetical protein
MSGARRIAKDVETVALIVFFFVCIAPLLWLTRKSTYTW